MDLHEIVFWTLVIVAISLWFTLRGRKRRHLLQNGIAATAKVLSINKTMVMIGQGSFARPQIEIVLEIENIGIPNNQLAVKQTFNEQEILPKSGNRISVLLDSSNSNNVMISSPINIIS